MLFECITEHSNRFLLKFQRIDRSFFSHSVFAFHFSLHPLCIDSMTIILSFLFFGSFILSCLTPLLDLFLYTIADCSILGSQCARVFSPRNFSLLLLSLLTLFGYFDSILHAAAPRRFSLFLLSFFNNEIQSFLFFFLLYQKEFFFSSSSMYSMRLSK